MSMLLPHRVRRRAGGRCEYCLVPEKYARIVPFQIEHIVSRQHGGSSELPNLALACHHCNLHKGPNLSGIDPVTGKLVPLFHPRRHRWARHFRWDGPCLVGRTAVGRAAVIVLAMNDRDMLRLRLTLIRERRFPPR